MDRLTEHCCAGGIKIKGCSTLYPDSERKGAPASSAIVRLAAYEDAIPIERAQELAQAEKDGRLVVLPCKVVDTVYCVITTHDTAPILTEIEIKSLSQAIELIGKIGEHKVLSYYLVREEAEAALKKKEADNEAVR